MRAFQKQLARLALATLFAAGFLSPAAAFAEEESFRFGLDNNNIVFLERELANRGSFVRLAVTGGQEADVVVELVDLFAGENGSKRALPLGSSPFSPEGLVRLSDDKLRYVPNGQFQFFEIPFNFRKGAEIVRPVLGGIKISLQSLSPSTGQFEISAEVVGTFTFYPADIETNLVSALEVSSLVLESDSGDFFPFNLIPDIPFVFNSWPVKASFSVKNSGEIFLEKTSVLSLQQQQFFGQGGSRSPLSFSSEKVLLLPNQVASTSITVGEGDSGKETTPSLGIGGWDILVEARGGLGDDLATVDSISQSIVIFPWKYSLTLIVVLFLLRKRIWKLATATLSFAKTLNKIRKSMEAQNEIDNTSALGPASLAPANANTLRVTTSENPRPETALGSADRSFLTPIRIPPLPSLNPSADLRNRGAESPRPLYPTWYTPPSKGTKGED